MIVRDGVFAGFCLELVVLTKRQKAEVEVAEMEICGTAQVKQVETKSENQEMVCTRAEVR